MFWDRSAAYERSRPGAYIIKARVQLLRDLGPCLSPFNAFLFLQGLETLPLRIKAHCRNALAVAEWLQANPQRRAGSTTRCCPATPTTSGRSGTCPNGAGAIVGFGIQGGLEAGKRFIDAVKLFSHLANIGDAKSLIIHPASTTHQQLTPEERVASGVTDDFIRLSIGTEDIADIIDDLDQAIAASQHPSRQRPAAGAERLLAVLSGARGGCHRRDAPDVVSDPIDDLSRRA